MHARKQEESLENACKEEGKESLATIEKGGKELKEAMKQHGGAIAEAAGGLAAIGLIGVALFGGGLGQIARMLSIWLYG